MSAGFDTYGRIHAMTLQRRFAASFVACAVFAGIAHAQPAPSWTVPEPSQRCPSKWGAGDERGSMNHMKPAAVLNAAKLIKSGELIELGHVLNGQMPFSACAVSMSTRSARS
jgi:hypothetical protein